jgi:hypothetical protein
MTGPLFPQVALMALLRADRAEIKCAIKALREPGIVVTEMRIPGTNDGVISGFFDDPDKLADAIEQRNGSGPGVYITLNAVKPALADQALNRVHIGGSTTKDADIEWRYWLLIDIDPNRSPDTSSTDAEHEAAIDLARKIRQVLGDLGGPSLSWRTQATARTCSIASISPTTKTQGNC